MKFATFLGSSPIIRSAERVNFHLLVHASPSHRKSPITIHALRNSRGAVDSLAQSRLLLIRQRARTCTCDGPVHLVGGLLIVREALCNHRLLHLSPIHLPPPPPFWSPPPPTPAKAARAPVAMALIPSKPAALCSCSALQAGAVAGAMACLQACRFTK